MKKSTPLFTLCILALTLTACSKGEMTTVSSFEECVAQTGVVMESYPRKCQDESGKTWIEEVEPQTPPPAAKPTDPDAPVMNPAGPSNPRTSKVLFPNGKENLFIGQSYTIRWESEGIEAVTLELRDERDKSIATITERVLAYNGVYEWTPNASLLGDKSFEQFKIIMIDSDTGKSHDMSDDFFVLQQEQTQ